MDKKTLDHLWLLLYDLQHDLPEKGTEEIFMDIEKVMKYVNNLSKAEENQSNKKE